MCAGKFPPVSSFPGLHTLDPPLSPPSAPAEFTFFCFVFVWRLFQNSYCDTFSCGSSFLRKRGSKRGAEADTENHTEEKGAEKVIKKIRQLGNSVNTFFWLKKIIDQNIFYSQKLFAVNNFVGQKTILTHWRNAALYTFDERKQLTLWSLLNI